jgi:hypothetical protein
MSLFHFLFFHGWFLFIQTEIIVSILVMCLAHKWVIWSLIDTKSHFIELTGLAKAPVFSRKIV